MGSRTRRKHFKIGRDRPLSMELYVILPSPSTYIGREKEKLFFFHGLFEAAMKSGNSALMRKASDEMKELADKTGLEMLKNEVERLKKY